MSDMLGRTNRTFPPVWLRLATPADPDRADELASAAREAQVPLDLSAQPAFWGPKFRGDETIVIRGGWDVANASSETNALELMEAGLFQAMCANRREHIDIFFFELRGRLQEFQAAGALEALETARQEGHIGHLGLVADCSQTDALSFLQGHDAFEVFLAKEQLAQNLAGFARSRRIGVAQDGDGAVSPKILPVSSAEQVHVALGPCEVTA